ncbi:hypothetical protein C4J81_16945 [Deltaproteobacteria bacterium Smac51]|nr:hypothetical protein C4J81_16945 [Deltaproteobacteria bacterium Smac51]
MSANTPVEKKPIKDLLSEKDAFLTTSDRIYEYFLRHTKGFIIVAVAVAAVVIAFAAYNKYEASAEEKALMAYESALESIVANPDKATEALETVRSDFKGRKAARMAAYTLASFYSAQNEIGKALAISEELLRTLPAAETALKPVLLGNLAGLYEAEKKYDEAAVTYETLLNLGTSQPALRRDCLLALGRINVAREKTEEAITNYQAVVNEFPNDTKAYMANSILVSLKGGPQAFPGSVLPEVAEVPAPADSEPAAAADENAASADTAERADAPAGEAAAESN